MLPPSNLRQTPVVWPGRHQESGILLPACFGGDGRRPQQEAQASKLHQAPVVRPGRHQEDGFVPPACSGGYGRQQERQKVRAPFWLHPPVLRIQCTKKAGYCSSHAKDGMIDVRTKRCKHPTCKTKPTYGAAGTRENIFCAKHAHDGMVDICNKKRCGHPSCNTRPMYGLEGTRQQIFLRKTRSHDGMMDTCSQRCGYSGCTTQPHYGWSERLKKTEFCGHYSHDGMEVIVNKRCGHPTCNKVASIGTDRAKKVQEFCVEHAKKAWFMSPAINAPTKVAPEEHNFLRLGAASGSTVLNTQSRERPTTSLEGASTQAARRTHRTAWGALRGLSFAFVMPATEWSTWSAGDAPAEVAQSCDNRAGRAASQSFLRPACRGRDDAVHDLGPA